jgi:hypothetical protein
VVARSPLPTTAPRITGRDQAKTSTCRTF